MDRGAPDQLLVDLPAFKEINQKAIERSRDRKIQLRNNASIRALLLREDAGLLRPASGIRSKLVDANSYQRNRRRDLGDLGVISQATDYLDVYASFGLLGDRSLFAHGIHNTEIEYEKWATAGASVIHCPTSNTFLGSGLFDANGYISKEINVALGSDVGGGFSLNPFVTMAEAYKVAKLRGQVLDPLRLMYWHTLGGAKAIHQHDSIGSLEPGKYADFCLIDITSDEVGSEYGSGQLLCGRNCSA